MQIVRTTESPEAAVAEPSAHRQAVDYFAAVLRFEVDCCRVRDLIRAGDTIAIVDVRRSEAFRLGRIPSAVNWPGGHQPDGDSCNPERVVVYGAGRGRLDAVRAALGLSKAGKHVRVLTGGFEAWSAEGFEIDRDSPSVVAI